MLGFKDQQLFGLVTNVHAVHRANYFQKGYITTYKMYISICEIIFMPFFFFLICVSLLKVSLQETYISISSKASSSGVMCPLKSGQRDGKKRKKDKEEICLLFTPLVLSTQE